MIYFIYYIPKLINENKLLYSFETIQRNISFISNHLKNENVEWIIGYDSKIILPDYISIHYSNIIKKWKSYDSINIFYNQLNTLENNSILFFRYLLFIYITVYNKLLGFNYFILFIDSIFQK